MNKCRLLCTVLAVGAFSLASASADIMVGFDPTNAMINDVGLTTTVDIVADIPENEPVLVWGLDLNVVNPGIADWELLSIGPSWAAAPTPDGDGLGGIAFPAGIWGDDILLATVQFTGFAVGTTEIFLSDDYPEDLTEGFYLDPEGVGVPQYMNGFVTVVPEPASLSLLVLGLLALRRR
jgi:hypothetical protein